MPNYTLPPVCDISVTNVCNAACDFCGFARDKTLAGPARYVDADAFSRALPILYRRGIRYITLQGGEPLVHPDIVRLVSVTAVAGISCAVITNGWFLPRYIGSLASVGLDGRPDMLAPRNILQAPWSARFAIVSIGAVIALAVTALWRVRLKIGYEAWHLSHIVLAVVAIAAGVAHMVGSGFYLVDPWKRALWIGASRCRSET